jgi:hypothetical protein
VNNYIVRIRKPVPFPNRSIVDFSLRRSGFEPGSVLMGFMDKQQHIVRVKCPMFLSGLTKFGHRRHIITRVSNIVHQNPSIRNPVFGAERERERERERETDGRTGMAMLLRKLCLIT